MLHQKNHQQSRWLLLAGRVHRGRAEENNRNVDGMDRRGAEPNIERLFTINLIEVII